MAAAAAAAVELRAVAVEQNLDQKRKQNAAAPSVEAKAFGGRVDRW